MCQQILSDVQHAKAGDVIVCMQPLHYKHATHNTAVTTTRVTHKHAVADNLLKQNFTMNRANQAWVGDITYIRIGRHQWMYLAVVIDLYSRKVIGWSMNKRMTADLVCNALLMALKARGNPKHVIVHTDRGSQYCSYRYQQLLQQYQLRGSMSAKGNCYDNAVCESFFHTLKNEQVYRFYYENHKQARQSIFEYIEAYYNRIRRHSSLNYQSPINFEKLAMNS